MCIRFQSKKLYRPFWNDITMTCKFDWKRVEAFPSSIVAHQLTTNIKCSAGSVVFPRFSCSSITIWDYWWKCWFISMSVYQTISTNMPTPFTTATKTRKETRGPCCRSHVRNFDLVSNPSDQSQYLRSKR